MNASHSPAGQRILCISFRSASETGRGLEYTAPRLIPSTVAWRLMLNFAVGSIIFLRPTLAHAGMCCRATGQQTRLAERAGQKIVLQRQFSDLGMQSLHVDYRFRFGFRGFAEYTGRPLKQLIAPLFDLVRLSVFASKHLPVTDGLQNPAPTLSSSSRP